MWRGLARGFLLKISASSHFANSRNPQPSALEERPTPVVKSVKSSLPTRVIEVGFAITGASAADSSGEKRNSFSRRVCIVQRKGAFTTAFWMLSTMRVFLMKPWPDCRVSRASPGYPPQTVVNPA
eukprot:CAMPEP_0180182182 /NCGR_PEP_ID=MMETSP0986-20121125/40530_1 /TAXON_ID=697907 /ORGANISM="non described non described, Strain CCMP2293" /LENGTH=124 /DNA_ID=CAMNT_0022135535 /DNA_START=160 /DNA_END=534 /DNA_ORIENTATION=+